VEDTGGHVVTDGLWFSPVVDARNIGYLAEQAAWDETTVAQKLSGDLKVLSKKLVFLVTVQNDSNYTPRPLVAVLTDDTGRHYPTTSDGCKATRVTGDYTTYTAMFDAYNADGTPRVTTATKTLTVTLPELESPALGTLRRAADAQVTFKVPKTWDGGSDAVQVAGSSPSDPWLGQAQFATPIPHPCLTLSKEQIADSITFGRHAYQVRKPDRIGPAWKGQSSSRLVSTVLPPYWFSPALIAQHVGYQAEEAAWDQAKVARELNLNGIAGRTLIFSVTFEKLADAGTPPIAVLTDNEGRRYPTISNRCAVVDYSGEMGTYRAEFEAFNPDGTARVTTKTTTLTLSFPNIFTRYQVADPQIVFKVPKTWDGN
jgi:hypothetical protein